MRPSAGYGWTTDDKGRHLIRNEAGEWIRSGKARGWKRCTRCRKPVEIVFDGGVCRFCFQKLLRGA